MSITIEARTPDSLKTWLSGWLAGELDIDRETIDVTKPFLSYGLNSIQAMMLAGDLETGLGCSLSPTLAWDYPCIADLADHLSTLIGRAPAAEPAGHGADHASAPSQNGALHAVPDPESILSRIDELSEEQVDALLRKYAG